MRLTKFGLGFSLFIMAFNSVWAWGWSDLWATPDQQAMRLMEQKKYSQARDKFKQADWKATAAFRAGDYQQAVQLFDTLHNPLGYYNKGNALAHQGHLEDAIHAYDEAQILAPEDQDIIYNRDLVKKMLEEQKQQQQDQDKKDKQDEDKQDQDKKDKQDQDKQDQDNKDKQDQQQQAQDQDNKDKQDQQKQAQDQDNKDKQDQQQPENKVPEKAAEQESAEEKQQDKERWLNSIMDDPGGLLKQKFMRDYLKRRSGQAL